MNLFKTGPVLLKIFGTARKYNSHIPEFKRLRKAGDIEGEKALIFSASGEWAEDASRILKLHYEIEGEENIPDKGPIMIYANHQGLADILALYYLFRNHFQIGFIAKNEWRKLKPLANAIEYTRSIFLVRDNPKEALKAVSECTDLLSKGFSMAIFPEGTRSQSHKIGPFRIGAFKFADKANIPILPITLDGSYKLFEETGDYKPDQTIKIKIHPLVHIEQMDKRQKKNAAIQIERTIREGLE
ncbi:MAG: 1-acyl-sn-glycerol-3-phosphate acyltransferase [Mogibacterium sp.]|nr:1-acyl-sn-glycerol-3-phosphate acyltransferase [Mogibacterium sp.]